MRRAATASATMNAYLDDYAYLLMAVIEVMQTRFRRQDFELARALADALLARFEDRKNGGFWFTSHDHEKLFHRDEAGARRRDTVREWHCRASADPARSPRERRPIP
jgi:uncharacterized protein YyaL (SSP411 family)